MYEWEDLYFYTWGEDIVKVREDGLFTVVTNDGKTHYVSIYVTISNTEYTAIYSVHINE